MGGHEVQWQEPKHAEMIVTDILKSVKELKGTGEELSWHIFQRHSGAGVSDWHFIRTAPLVWLRPGLVLVSLPLVVSGPDRLVWTLSKIFDQRKWHPKDDTTEKIRTCTHTPLCLSMPFVITPLRRTLPYFLSKVLTLEVKWRSDFFSCLMQHLK